jgi:cytochrome o ubiquinol oxidase subunit II
MKRIKYVFFCGLPAMGIALLLGGCDHLLLLDPKGPIGDTERFVIIASFVLMLIVVIPVVVMTLIFPWKYRASNPKATYTPKWSSSVKIESVIWLVPAVIVILLGTLVWTTTHRLDPYKPIDTGVKPINIQAVSMDWKWLFIYPDQNIATLNQLVFPANVPLSFRLTSDTVMASFFIPQLGSQIYTMAGMQTQLHLMADEPGVYTGQNQQFTGRGYAEMNFKAVATSPQEYEAWLQKVRSSPDRLDMARYAQLEKPGVDSSVVHFSSVKPGLFDHILRKYDHAMAMDPGAATRPAAPAHPQTSASEGS